MRFSFLHEDEYTASMQSVVIEGERTRIDKETTKQHSHFYSGIRDGENVSPGDVLGANGALPSENETSGPSK